jgi:hypothetical protein
LNSTREKDKGQGYIYKRVGWDLCANGGINLGVFQKVQDT